MLTLWEWLIIVGFYLAIGASLMGEHGEGKILIIKILFPILWFPLILWAAIAAGWQLWRERC